MRHLRTLLCIAAAAGWLMCCALNIMSLAGLHDLPPSIRQFVTLGTFVVWLPAMLFSYRASRDVPRSQFWKASLSGGPRWFERAMKAFFLYALAWFALTFLASDHGNRSPGGINLSLGTLTAFCMLFYGVAFMLFYASLHAKTNEPSSS